MSIKYVSVSGYGWTGSGACIDLLKEFSEFDVLHGEFRIAKDPYGLVDLESSLVNNWDFIRHDIAIRDFLQYCEFLSRETGLFKKQGGGFSGKLDINFILESKAYIDRLTDMTYIGNTFVHRYNISFYRNFIYKVRNKFKKNNGKIMYFSRPTASFFLKETSGYINNLFTNYVKQNNVSTIVFDNAIPPTNISNTIKFFHKMKVIIIDRDPRDVYVELVGEKRLIGSDLAYVDSADKYIKWHKQLRRISVEDGNNLNINKQVLRMRFEDLVFKYDESVEKIIKFLGGGMQHDNIGKYFSPVRSSNNIGLWKNYHDQLVMDKIGKELKRYCYHG